MEAILHQLQSTISSFESKEEYKDFDLIIRVDGMNIINIVRVDDVYLLFGVDETKNSFIIFCQEFIPTLIIRPKENEHRIICGFSKKTNGGNNKLSEKRNNNKKEIKKIK